MPIKLSMDVRNARLDSVEDAIGASAILRIRSGSMPAECAEADLGVVLVEMVLPEDWMSAAVGGVKSKLGAWEGVGAAVGTANHFRIYDNGGKACHLQGTVTGTGEGGDLQLDNVSVAVSQAVNVTSFTISDGNG